MNPIEHIIDIVNKKLSKDAIDKGIKHEILQKETMLNIPVSVIDKTIASMSKRLHMIIK